MSFSAILFLAIGLSMDAVAVSAASGLAARRVLPRHVALVAAFFGGSQALMPLLGWAIGRQAGPPVRAWGPWIAFLLLSAIGAKMLWDARERGGGPHRDDLFGLRVLTMLALATSIDALVAGVALQLLNASLALASATIGITTAVLSAVGLFAGRRFGSLLGSRLDVAGGLVLIGLGLKVLVEHLLAAR